MLDWELEKWKQELSGAITRLSHDKHYQENCTYLDICPANIKSALEEMG